MAQIEGDVFAGAVVRSVSIENLINQRTAVLRDVRTALETLNAAEDLAIAAHLGFPRICLEGNYGRTAQSITGPHSEIVDAVFEKMRKEIDAGAWKYLMHESGLRTFMDAQSRKQWDEQIGKETVPDLTWQTIEATFSSLYAARGEMFERGVIECFRRLSWHYKTNLPQKFGKRIVMPHIYLYGHTNPRVTDELDDLIRVFCVLEKRPEPDHREGVQTLLGKAEAEPGRWRKSCENDYLHIKVFKNGNGHILFKKLELVEQLNKIIAKHYPNALAAPRK